MTAPAKLVAVSCSVCGKPRLVPAQQRGRTKYCVDCAAHFRRERGKIKKKQDYAKQKRARTTPDIYSYILLHDPCPDPLAIGGEFSKEEVKWMLKMDSVLVGTRFARNGKEYEVKLREGGLQLCPTI